MGGLSDIAAKTTATIGGGWGGGVTSKEDGLVVSCSSSFLWSVPNPSYGGRDALGNSGTSCGHINNQHGRSHAAVSKCHSCSHAPSRSRELHHPELREQRDLKCEILCYSLYLMIIEKYFIF